VLSRPDVRDWSSLPPADINWSDLDLDVRGSRVAVHVDAGVGMPVDPAVAGAVEAVAAIFASAGAVVEQIAPFMTPTMLEDLDLFWRVRFWNDFAALPPKRQRNILPFIVNWCSRGAQVSGARTISCYHSIMELSAATVAATAAYDLVLSPVAPTVAFPAEWPMPFGEEDCAMAHIGFTAPYNMSGQPACSINCGFTDDGKTIGVQIAGRRFDDLGVLRAAAWYEQARAARSHPALADLNKTSTGANDSAARPCVLLALCWRCVLFELCSVRAVFCSSCVLFELCPVRAVSYWRCVVFAVRPPALRGGEGSACLLVAEHHEVRHQPVTAEDRGDRRRTGSGRQVRDPTREPSGREEVGRNAHPVRAGLPQVFDRLGHLRSGLRDAGVGDPRPPLGAQQGGRPLNGRQACGVRGARSRQDHGITPQRSRFT